MKFVTKSRHGGWECEYDIDDETGRLRSVGCSQRRYFSEALGMWIEPTMGYGRDVLGWQAEAGEEDQSAPGWGAS